jgi:hypothetical protein
MVLQLTIHSSWASVPVALSRILTTLAALEHARQPDDDLSDLDDDLRQLLDGIDGPEPAPAATPASRHAALPASRPAATPAPAMPPAARPSAKPFEGIPTTWRQMYIWACDRKALPDVNRLGKQLNYARRVTDWTDSEVATAYALLTTETATADNGKVR